MGKFLSFPYKPLGDQCAENTGGRWFAGRSQMRRKNRGIPSRGLNMKTGGVVVENFAGSRSDLRPPPD